MNAPEKIYVDSKAIGDHISTTVRITPQDYPTCTEYTRTDVVVNKALRWMISQGGINDVLSREMIEDFKSIWRNKA